MALSGYWWFGVTTPTPLLGGNHATTPLLINFINKAALNEAQGWKDGSTTMRGQRRWRRKPGGGGVGVCGGVCVRVTPPSPPQTNQLLINPLTSLLLIGKTLITARHLLPLIRPDLGGGLQPPDVKRPLISIN